LWIGYFVDKDIFSLEAYTEKKAMSSFVVELDALKNLVKSNDTSGIVQFVKSPNGWKLLGDFIAWLCNEFSNVSKGKNAAAAASLLSGKLYLKIVKIS